jgi:hypothetical protein
MTDAKLMHISDLPIPRGGTDSLEHVQKTAEYSIAQDLPWCGLDRDPS